MVDKLKLEKCAIVIVLSLILMSPYFARGNFDSLDKLCPTTCSITIFAETVESVHVLGKPVLVRIFVVNEANEFIEFPIYSIAYDIYDSNGKLLIGCIIDYFYDANHLPTFAPKSKNLFERLIWNQKTIDGKNVRIGVYRMRIFINSIVNCICLQRQCEITIKIVCPDLDAFPRFSKWGLTFY